MKNLITEHWKLIVGVVIMAILLTSVLILTGLWWKPLVYLSVVAALSAIVLWGLNLIHDWYMEQ